MSSRRKLTAAKPPEASAPPVASGLPEIPPAASELLVAAAQRLAVAQAETQTLVSVILTTLGLDVASHEIHFEDGRAVVRRKK